MKQYLEACEIINIRGLKGEVKVDCFCDSLDVLCDIKTLYFDENGNEPVKVLSAKPYKGFVYLLLEGVSDADCANKIRGRSLFAHRDDIPVDDGGYFIEDLLGLSVIDAESGKVYGTISDVFNSGASDIYTVTKDGKDNLFPAVSEFIEEIDLEKGVFVRPIPGMFDEAEEIK